MRANFPRWVVLFVLMLGCAKHPGVSPPKTAASKPASAGGINRQSIAPGPNLQALSAYQKGVEFYAKENLEAAAKAFEEAQKIAPGLALPAYGSGLVCLRRNQFKEAAAAFSRAIANKTNFPQAYLGLGIAQRHLGEFRAAERAYLEGIKYDGSLANLHYNLGILYEVYLGEPKDALKQYQVYLSLAQKNADERVKTWVSLLQKD